jgi:hypothetical protein
MVNDRRRFKPTPRRKATPKLDWSKAEYWPQGSGPPVLTQIHNFQVKQEAPVAEAKLDYLPEPEPPLSPREWIVTTYITLHEAGKLPDKWGKGTYLANWLQEKQRKAVLDGSCTGVSAISTIRNILRALGFRA